MMVKRKWPYGRLDEFRRMLVTVALDVGDVAITTMGDVGDAVWKYMHYNV